MTPILQRMIVKLVVRTTAKTCKQNCCFYKLFIFLTLLIRLLPRFLSRISRVLRQARINKILSKVSRGNGNLRENPRSWQELQDILHWEQSITYSSSDVDPRLNNNHRSYKIIPSLQFFLQSFIFRKAITYFSL